MKQAPPKLALDGPEAKGLVGEEPEKLGGKDTGNASQNMFE